MRISERFEATLLEWSEKWKETLRGWLVSVLGFGLELFADIIGKAFAPKLTPLITKLESLAEIPPELQAIFNEIKQPTGEVGAFLAQAAGGSLVGGAIGSVIDALFLPFSYDVNNRLHPRLPNEAQLIMMWLRKIVTDDNLTGYLRKLGADDLTITTLKELSQVRLDTNTVAKAWLRDREGYDFLWKDLEDSGLSPDRIQIIKRLSELRLNPETISRLWIRDKENNEKFWTDLKDVGFTEDRIEVFKELTKVMPTPQELVGWMAHEVFEPDAVRKYGLDDEFEKLDLSLFDKVGVSVDMARNHWRDHWQHPAFIQMIEMLHRDLITEADLWEWFRLVEIPPFWRDKLIGTIWTIPTRVDVRRWYDMRTIDEEELRAVYKRQGYHDKDLDNYVIWTKVYTEFPSLMARFTKGWIDRDEVKAELLKLGMPEDRAETMIQEKVAPEKPERVIKERDLTKTEIYKGVKAELISPDIGLELLQELGYDADEARYILLLNVEALRGSPETYSEFKQLTQLYRKSQGLPAKLVPRELVEAEKDLKQAETVYKESQLDGSREREVEAKRVAKEQAAYRYNQLYNQWLNSKES